MLALQRCWRAPLLQLMPLLHSKVPLSTLGRPSQAEFWPFWPALVHVGAGECGAHSSCPKAVCVTPSPGQGPCGCWSVNRRCGFAEGVCKSHLLLQAAWRHTKQSGPCPASFLAALVHLLSYGSFLGT